MVANGAASKPLSEEGETPDGISSDCSWFDELSSRMVHILLLLYCILILSPHSVRR